MGQDIGVGHSVSSGYAKDTADASQVKELSLFSYLATVVHVSLPNISVLKHRHGVLPSWSTIFTISLGLVHTREVRQASVVAAFPILLSISVSKERLSVTVEPR